MLLEAPKGALTVGVPDIAAVAEKEERILLPTWIFIDLTWLGTAMGTPARIRKPSEAF